MSEDPVSLAVIDPEVADIDGTADDDAAVDQVTTEAKEPISAVSESEGTKGKKAKKQPKGVVRGSTADYRRKEANRLAAERSRSRQSERRAGLDEAFKRLSEENTRLAEDIARLERAGGDGPTREDLAEAVSTLQSPENQHDRDQSVHVEDGNGHDAMDAEAEAQAHSRTILAALMSNAEIDQALGEDWMNHVDEAEVGGTNTPAQPHAEHETEGHLPSEDRQEDIQEKVEFDNSTPAGDTDVQGEVGQAPDQPHQHGIAVALHAEMERHLRDDLAATKAAIDQIDKELAVLRGQASGESLSQSTYVSTLPAQYSSSDSATLVGVLSELDAEMLGCSDRATSLRAQAAQVRESRLSGALQLQDLLASVTVDAEDAELWEKAIKPLQTHLAGLITSLQSDDTGSFASLPGSRMAAAIAPRRRGRPPRHQSVGRPATKSTGTRKSRLRKEILPDGSEVVHADRASTSRTPGAHGPSQDTPADMPSADHQHEAEAATMVPDADTTGLSHLEIAQLADEQPELTTEEIISQLTHDEQDLHDLLRSHAQAEYDAEQQAQNGGMSLDAQFEGAGDGPNLGQGSTSNIDPALGQSLDDSQDLGPTPPGSCDICSRTQTTVWRRIHLGDRDLHVCNPCGMYHIKTGQIRPRELWGDGKLIRKRRKSTHPRPRKSDAKRLKVDGDQVDDDLSGDQILDGSQVEDDLTVDNLGDVVGHDEFRATLGMEGLGDIITGFGDQTAEEVAQDVANVFGNVE